MAVAAKPKINVKVSKAAPKQHAYKDLGKLNFVAMDNALSTKYAKCLVFPKDNACRVPTAYNNHSALIATKRTFPIKLQTRNNVVDNRFAFYVQPKIGDPSDPGRFQIAQVDFSKGEYPDLTNPANYIGLDDSGASLAIDPNAPWITQSRPSAYGIDVSAPTFANPLANAANHNYTVGGKSTVLTYGPQWFTVLGSVAGTNDLVIPPGSYLLSIRTTFESPIPDGTPLRLAIVRGTKDDNVGVSTRLMSGAPSRAAQDNTWAILLTDADVIRLNWDPATMGGGINPSRVEIIATPLCSPAVSWSSNYGLAEQVRVVGMSVLTTCVLTDLKAGGTITADVFPASSKDKIMTGTWLRPGGLSSGAPHYFTGNLKEGNYCWWRPFSENDIEFMEVDVANSYEFPTIMVKGNCPDGTGGSDTVVNVTVEFVYEVLHNTQLLEGKKSDGSTAIYEAALRALEGVKSTSENPEHSSLLKDIGKIMHEGAKFLPLIGML